MDDFGIGAAFHLLLGLAACGWVIATILGILILAGVL